MQDAVPAGGRAAMAAIHGIYFTGGGAGCLQACGAGEICTPANLNSPEQTVISGHASAVKRAGGDCFAVGAKRSRLPDRYPTPFHSAFFDDAGAGKAGKGSARNESSPICKCPWSPMWTPTPFARAMKPAKPLISPGIHDGNAWQESMRLLLDEGGEYLCRSGAGPRADRLDAPDRAFRGLG